MRKLLILATILAGSLAASASAAEFTVEMLNKGEKGGMVFQPDFVKAAPGDTVKFVSVDKGHNAESIKGMLPAGVEPFKSKISEEYVLTVEKEGLYGVKCTPHYGMGMVMLIAAGNPVNEAEARAVKQNGKAKERFADIFAQFDAAK
jgi:pseudoazurin